MAWLKQIVNENETIKPWLILGPYNQDVSDEVIGLTLYEREGATVGASLMVQAAEEAGRLLAKPHVEGERCAWRGEERTWELVRRPEKYLLWGTYNISNHLGAAFLTNNVQVKSASAYSFELSSKITGRAMVYVDGKLAFDTADSNPEMRGVFRRWAFQLELSGTHTLSVALFRVGRMAQIGFKLVCTNAALTTWLPDTPGLSPEAREAVEAEIASLRLERDMFHPEDDVALITALAARPFKASLENEDGLQTASATFSGSGRHVLLQGAELPDGIYNLICDWLDEKGQRLTGTQFEIKKTSPLKAPLGDDKLAERQRLTLEHYADNTERHSIFEAVARYALGRYDEIASQIEYTCDFIAARKDCADFAIQGLLRLMYWERKEQHLSDALNALMKDTILGFKYWVDEPGDTVMYMGSENHRMLFHVAEWMAGQLFPTEEFTNSGMRGLYHSTKGRMYITEWFRQRGRFGFDEWHSNSYFPISMAPVINVYDFAIGEDSKLREMAGYTLDYMCTILATDTYEGILGTTHGRSYGRYLKHPDMEGTSSLCWQLWGTGSLSKGTSGIAAALLATSAYRAPAILTPMALDKKTVLESRERQGLHHGGIQSAEFVVFRTPDYQISGVQDYRKGEYESSSHPAQVTLSNKNVIFWSCPNTCEEGGGARPDYWSGCTTLPRVIQYRNVMSLTFQPSEAAWMTHCFFEQDRFDEVRYEGNWAFCRVAEGYVAIYSQHGFTLGDRGQYAGRELVCVAEENTWLVECGRQADWGTFDAFVEAIVDADLRPVEGGLAYDSPSVGRFVTGWDLVPTVGGEKVNTEGYALVDSPWAYSRYGSGEISLSYENERYTIWLNQ